MLARLTMLGTLAALCVAGCGGSPSQDPSTAASESSARSDSAESEPGSSSGSEDGNATTGNSDREEQAAAQAEPVDPYADMPHPPPSDSGRFELISSDASGVVDAYRPHVRKLCWTPRVSEDTAANVEARVAMQIEVNPDGTVKSAKASGAKDYPGLATCVEDHALRWRFPTAKRISPLMFPLVFTRGEVEIIQIR